MSSSTSTSKASIWLVIYVFALLVAGAVGWIYASKYEPETQFWTAAFAKRDKAIAELPDGPRYLFTGDSACAFAIDTEVAGEVLGRPVVNLGGTRQMGTAVFMSKALAVARKGDVIVMICNPELLLVRGGGRLNRIGAKMAIAAPDGEVYRGASIEYTKDIVEGMRPGLNHLLTLAGKVALRLPRFRYTEDNVKPTGQVVTDLRDHGAPTTEAFAPNQEEDGNAAQELLEWGEKAQSQGVELIFVVPTEMTDESIISSQREAKEKWALTIKKHSGVPAILVDGGCWIDGDRYADTLFHLTEEGAREYTRQLAQQLKEWKAGQ